jgi:hypothetical protein
LVAALIGLGVALAGVALVIWRAGALLSDEWLTLGQLSSDEFQSLIKKSGNKSHAAVIYQEVEKYREELYGNVATSLGGLYNALKTTNEQMRSSPGTEAEAAQLAARSADVRTAVKNVVDFANYRRTRTDFEALRRALGWAGIAAVGGLVAFAVATNPPGKGSDQHPACCTISPPPCCTSTPASTSAYRPTPDSGPSPTPDPGPSPTADPAPSPPK